MADNATVYSGSDGTAIPVATDEIAGAHHQLVVVEWGAPDAATRVTLDAPLPVGGVVDEQTYLNTFAQGSVAPFRFDQQGAAYVNLLNQYSGNINVRVADAITLSVSASFYNQYRVVVGVSTDPYVAGDQIGPGGIDFGNVGNGSEWRTTTVTDRSKQNKSLTLLLFGDPLGFGISAGVDNDPVAVAAADIEAAYIGAIVFNASDYIDAGGASVCDGHWIGEPPVSALNHPLGILVAGESVTYTDAADLTLILGAVTSS